MNTKGEVYMDQVERIPAEDRERYERAQAAAVTDDARAKLEAAEARARIAWEHPASNPPLTFNALRSQNVPRMERWHATMDEWTGADWSNAMCGEAGETANVVKKLRRHQTGGGSGYNTPDEAKLREMLADELADVIAYADLLAHHYGIDLGRAVAAKFNRVSEAQGFPERV